MGLPKFQKVNLDKLENKALTFDKQGYSISDADFASRHPLTLNAEHLYEQGALRDQYGDSTLLPQTQAEFQRAGLSDAFNSFGDSYANGANLAPGSAGEAGVARNLGLSTLAFQDRNRANRTASLAMTESLFPRRTFGLTGENAASISMANTMGQNNFNQANYALSKNIQAQQQSSNSNLLGAGIGAVASIAGAVLMSYCWVARAAYGQDQAWRVFRYWLLTDAPGWLRTLYGRHGEAAGRIVGKYSALQAIARAAMSPFINGLRAKWEHATN